jgi:ribosomal protein S18 acetylase RimI-like enzyme
VPIRFRLLGPGDEEVLRTLSVEAGRFEGDGVRRYEALAAGDAARFLGDEANELDVAFDGDRPGGMLLAYELARRHGPARMLLVYELGVDVDYRRRGIGRELMQRLAARARERGISQGFLITDERNTAALALYRSVGAVREEDDEVVLDLDFS